MCSVTAEWGYDGYVHPESHLLPSDPGPVRGHGLVRRRLQQGWAPELGPRSGLWLCDQKLQGVDRRQAGEVSCGDRYSHGPVGYTVTYEYKGPGFNPVWWAHHLAVWTSMLNTKIFRYHPILGRMGVILSTNKVERGFDLLVQAANPSEKWVVHWGGHPSKYYGVHCCLTSVMRLVPIMLCHNLWKSASRM